MVKRMEDRIGGLRRVPDVRAAGAAIRSRAGTGQGRRGIWKHGYAATSLDDLVAATGMNRPSLYAAFGDKCDLYLKR